MPIEAGFRKQRLAVIPRPVVTEALVRPITRRLVVTDAGYYPNAADHLMQRPEGAAETILIICVAGTGWAAIGDTRHRIGSNTALVIPNGTPHAYGASADSPWTICWCHLRGSDLPELVAEMSVTPARPIVPIRHIDRSAALLDEIVSSLERSHSAADLVGAAGTAWKLLTQLVVDRALPAPGDPVERAMQYLSERFDGDIRVSELAALVGVSSSHLSARFRKATGGGVLAFQTSLRMARARHLLDTTTAPVGEIARDVGYHDQFYFSRHFRRLHDASPSEYRARSKG
ncbi:helix-turn-helix domain-containing protein [Agromyces ramosus]|uniref:AraC-like DNA-binding protein n=1 Tax=Agromyces ramosus TaxID=33879 RepID=A0ABU0RAQ0_9MICO|nr:helix-turn-helix domain-containing protein [Agromyces ramosus]MDQ0895155.1 AraC-like DNA-binding protein [Agromyces ramosus]